MPFVQGLLRRERLSAAIETACAHCGQPIRLTVDSALNIHVQSAGAQPLVFEPQVNWAQFTGANIIDAY